jgi:hypothetical protein
VELRNRQPRLLGREVGLAAGTSTARSRSLTGTKIGANPIDVRRRIPRLLTIVVLSGNRSRRASATIAAIAGAAVIGCHPQIVRFEAAPQRLCANRSTRLEWEVKGSADLAARPPVAGTGKVSSSGSKPFAIAETTTFTLTAERFGSSKVAEQEIEAFSVGGTKSLLGRTSCEAGAIVAVATLPANEWDDLARVDTVRIVGARTIMVSHADRKTTLGPKARRSEEFRGAPVAGEWILRAPLLPDEVCGNPEHHPPATLGLTVTISCGA